MNTSIFRNIEEKINDSTILFFDMDWTLIDTDYVNFLSYKKAIQTTVNKKAIIKYNTQDRFNRNSLKKIIPNITKFEYEKVVIEKERYYKDYLHTTKINPLSIKILNNYYKKNKIYLVTNCLKDRVFETLNYHNLIYKFDYIFYREINDNENKFIKAIERLNILPEWIMVFENDEIEKNNAIKSWILEDNVILIPNNTKWNLL